MSLFSLHKVAKSRGQCDIVPRLMTRTPPPTEAGTTAGTGAPLRRLHILVADDNRDTVLTLMMLLREEGHEVQGVYDGAAALRAARGVAFDAMIVDIDMPGLDGYALARELC